MSMYGPPGGPYPGQPSDPWQGGQPHDPYPHPTDPYAQPADPYAQPYGQPQPEQWGGAPASAAPASPTPYGQPGAYDQGYGQPPGQQTGYGQPPYGQQPGFGGEVWTGVPEQKKGSGKLIGMIAVIVLLITAGAGAAYYFLAVKPKATVAVGASTGASAATSPSPSPSPSRDLFADIKAAKVGDCFVNDGTDEDATMRKVTCAAGSYEILKRFDGTASEDKCKGTYLYWYIYDGPPKKADNTADFILCMKKRT